MEKSFNSAVVLMANDWLKLGLEWFDAMVLMTTKRQLGLDRGSLPEKSMISDSGWDCSNQSEKKWMELPLKIDVSLDPFFSFLQQVRLN